LTKNAIILPRQARDTHIGKAALTHKERDDAAFVRFLAYIRYRQLYGTAPSARLVIDY
jgi:hypothetical protein